MSNQRTSQKSKGKRQRVGFGASRTRLQLSEQDLKGIDDSGYRPYWFNDEGGSVQRAEAAGYVFVKPEEVPSLGETELHEGNTDMGTRVSKIVNKTNPPLRAFLMKIKKEFYNEDRAAAEEQNAEVDRALKDGHAGGANIENQYGNVSIERR